MSDEDEELGIYFKCFRGANAHFAMSEPNSFAIQDAAGRDWICYPVPPHVVKQLNMLSDLVAVERADKTVGEETDVRLVFAASAAELPGRLASNPMGEE